MPLPALRTPAADPDAPELLDAADWRTVVVEWNHPDADYPAERCILCAHVPSPLPRRAARSATVEDPGAAAFPVR